jgi:hypothetical protein
MWRERLRLLCILPKTGETRTSTSMNPRPCACGLLWCMNVLARSGATGVCKALLCSDLAAGRALGHQHFFFGGVTGVLAAVIILHGALDVTCSPTVAKAALEKMSAADKTWVLLTEARHDLELDLWKDEWHAYVTEWLARQSHKWTLRGGRPANTTTASTLQELKV